MMNNGISATGGIPVPGPVNAVPGARVPTVIPAVVEPASAPLVRKGKKRGPKPIETTLRMELINQFINGSMPKGEIGRLDFIRVCQLTPREKSYLVNHACFKELYDARVFDFFLDPTQLPSKEELKLLEIVGRRVGLSKPATQVNVQVNNSRSDKKSEGNDPISIRVQR